MVMLMLKVSLTYVTEDIGSISIDVESPYARGKSKFVPSPANKATRITVSKTVTTIEIAALVVRLVSPFSLVVYAWFLFK